MCLPTVQKIYDAEAGGWWNIICFPLVSTIGLLWRSILIYVLPCFRVVGQRLANFVHKTVCCCWGWPYEDEDFIGAKALGDFSKFDANKPTAEAMEEDTDWVRAHELDAFGGRRPQLFEGKIEPDDLCQGAVGDCWLVAAFACASEHPDSIRRLFRTREYNPRGLYAVKIFDPIKKKWTVVHVDDRIPCRKGTKRPLFMNPNGSELWAIILEKAYAKFCGSYASLEGGFVLWGWHAMTGDNVFQMSKDKSTSSVTWFREDMVAIDDKEDKRSCGFRKTKETYSEEQLWSLLKKYDRQKGLISASIGKTTYGKYSGPSGEQILEKEGLAAGHAYSVIQAREVTDSRKLGLGALAIDTDVTRNKPKLRLMQLRNPWGTFEWKGDWSDKSPLWKEHPNVKNELGMVDADDGSFWMDFEDFKKIYTRVNVCDRGTDHDASLDANENDGSCGIITGCLCGCFDFWICCKGFRNLYCGRRSSTETLDTKENCCYHVMA